MRVLHICQIDDPDNGGSLRVAEALIRAQRAAGVDARLLFLYGEPGRISNEFGEGVYGLGLTSSKQVIKGVVGLVAKIRSIAPEIIHSHDGIMWPRLAFLLARAPVVTHGHLPPEVSGGIKQWLGWPLVKTTTRRVIGISEHTADEWAAAGFPRPRIDVIANGVDFNRFVPRAPEEKRAARQTLGLPIDKLMLVWVGRLHRSMKGTDRVEKVAAMLPTSATLVIVGNGPELEGMNERLAGLIEDDRVVMVGSADLPELYYEAADAYLFTSHVEPFGLVLLEAVACGLPILAFPVEQGGGAVKLLEEFEADMLNDDLTAEELQRHLTGLADLTDRRVRLREGAMDYSWTAIERRVADMYEKTLKEASR